MKLRISLIGLSTLFISIAFFVSCAKKNDTFAQQESQWLSYNGQNETVKKIIEDLKNSGRSVNVQSACNTCAPDWDQSVVTGVIGDSILHMLVPVINSEKICSGYIKISLQRDLHTTDLTVRDFENDYVNTTDLNKKGVIGMDFTVLYKKGIKVPSAFSPGIAKKLFNQQLKAKKETNARTNARTSEVGCTSQIYLMYYIDVDCIASTEQIHNLFMLYFKSQLQLNCLTCDAYLYYDYISVSTTAELAGENLTSVVQNAFSQVAMYYSTCHLYIEDVFITTTCSGSDTECDTNAQEFYDYVGMAPVTPATFNADATNVGSDPVIGSFPWTVAESTFGSWRIQSNTDYKYHHYQYFNTNTMRLEDEYDLFYFHSSDGYFTGSNTFITSTYTSGTTTNDVIDNNTSSARGFSVVRGTLYHESNYKVKTPLCTVVLRWTDNIDNSLTFFPH